ncbi:MAG: class I SAM-dependent methyltransferase [Alphaproteobacteria bacterium]
MSRLDSVIRRLEAQRACLNLVAEKIRDLPGLVLELGLGNGRTYDHLREILPDREIFVFERKVAADPDCVPDADHLLLGDIHETLPAAVARFGPSVALVHSDLGTGDSELNRRLAEFLAARLPGLLRPGAVVISDQDMGLEGAVALPLPGGVRPGRYFMCQAR